jgi:predicted metal-dependent phosphoesterase TrpH
MLRVEFHCHTYRSKDSLASIEKLLQTCRRKGIDRLVITDHNTITGAKEAQALDPERVIVGEEIKTQAGELLCAFMQEEIPAGLPPLEAIERLRAQGAFISVSHPFDVVRNGHWELHDLIEITPYVDAIETFNARCMSADYNRQAQAFAEEHEVLGTAGSDAHAPFELGRGAMLLPDFQDAASMKSVLPQVRFEARLSSPLVHFTSRYASWYKLYQQSKEEKGKTTS